jgi:LysW-gamma-L-lysine carboxypeptidase
MGDVVDLLRDLVSIPSPTGSTSEAVEFLRGWCTDNGMEAVVDKGALVVNPEARELLLIGHIDTVPGEVPVRIDNGELWGRGSVDAKGPLCTALAALRDLPSLRGRIRIIGVPDEEGSSETAYRLRRELDEMDCIVLEPSGWEGITISYNGRMLVDMTVEARVSHSGHDEPFSTEKALNIWGSMGNGSPPRILSINGDMKRTIMKLDIRYGSGERPELPTKEEGVSFRILEDVSPYRSDKGSRLVRSMLRSVRSRGGVPVFKKKTGTADMNVLGEIWGTPIIAYGPGDGRLDHTDEERLSIEEYLKSIEVLKGALISLLEP